MQTKSLHDDLGVEVSGLDLFKVTAEVFYPELRALFEQHSLLLFRGQIIDEDRHRALAELFGPLEDLTDKDPGAVTPRPMLTNVTADGELAGRQDLRLLNLQSNFIWHTDSTFLPRPAISNILTAYQIPSSGGNTEFVSTRTGWQRMPEALKQRARDRVFVHRYAHSRKQVDATLGAQIMFTKWPDTPWRSIWRNPANGTEALFISAHACGVKGLPEPEGKQLLDDLSAAVTGPAAIYSHKWQAGDVLIWDQRATMHRGTPWPYDEARTLASFVSSACESDGLASVRP